MEGKADYLMRCQVTRNFPPITTGSLYFGTYDTVSDSSGSHQWIRSHRDPVWESLKSYSPASTSSSGSGLSDCPCHVVMREGKA